MQPCCIPLRPLRDQRENTRKSTQSIRTEETSMSPADLSDLRRQTTKQQNTLTSPICLSLRNNAALPIPLRNQRENTHVSILNQSTKKKPQYLSQIYADEPQNHTNYKLSFSAE